MRQWKAPLTLTVALLLAGAVAAAAQPQRSGATIGSCVVVQTTVRTVETPIDLRAVGSCEAGGDGGTRDCTAEIVPTAPDVTLDVNDRNGEPRCLRLAGDDPCTFVQNGPVVFQSDRRASQSFSVASDRVRMTAMIRQKRTRQETADLPPGPRFRLVSGRLFDVLKSKSAVSARLECSMTDGDQRIFPVVGEADLSPSIVFVSRNASDPTFDVLTYRVTGR